MAESVTQAAMGSDAKAPLNAGTIAGIVIGSILFIVILIAGYLYFQKRHPKVSHQRTPSIPHRQRQNMGMTQTSNHAHAMSVLPAGSSLGRASGGNDIVKGEGLV